MSEKAETVHQWPHLAKAVKNVAWLELPELEDVLHIVLSLCVTAIKEIIFF